MLNNNVIVAVFFVTATLGTVSVAWSSTDDLWQVGFITGFNSDSVATIEPEDVVLTRTNNNTDIISTLFLVLSSDIEGLGNLPAGRRLSTVASPSLFDIKGSAPSRRWGIRSWNGS